MRAEADARRVCCLLAAAAAGAVSPPWLAGRLAHPSATADPSIRLRTQSIGIFNSINGSEKVCETFNLDYYIQFTLDDKDCCPGGKRLLVPNTARGRTKRARRSLRVGRHADATPAALAATRQSSRCRLCGL